MSEEEKITRRQLLKMMGGAVVLSAGPVALTWLSAPSETVVRPPGALREDLFLQRCTRCGKCATVCPTGAVTLADFSYGWRLEGTPVVTGMCQMLKCSRCSEVCPTGDLIRFDRHRADIGTAAIDRSKCVAWPDAKPDGQTQACLLCQARFNPSVGILVVQAMVHAQERPRRCRVSIPQSGFWLFKLSVPCPLRRVGILFQSLSRDSGCSSFRRIIVQCPLRIVSIPQSGFWLFKRSWV